MDIRKETWQMMDPEIVDRLMSCPGAFKTWVVCVWEDIDADDLYRKVDVQEMYHVNRKTIYNNKELINRAFDEYVIMSAVAHYY